MSPVHAPRTRHGPGPGPGPVPWHQRQRLLASLATACCAATLTALPASAQTAGDVGSGMAVDARGNALAQLHRELDDRLKLTPHDSRSPAVVQALQATLARERPRMQALLAQWLDEELQQPGVPAAAEAAAQVSRRLVNELALWRVDSTGPAHDALMRQAELHPRACFSDEATLSNLLANQISTLPEAAQAAALQAQAELLSRWGLSRPPMPTPGVGPGPEAQALALVDAHINSGQALPVPLPPALSWRLLVESPRPGIRDAAWIRCLLRQWHQAVVLHRAPETDPLALWRAHRMAWASDASTWWTMPPTQPEAEPVAYPWLARQLLVEGVITLEVVQAADGAVRDVLVHRRDIRVPGIRDQLPLAFLRLLDAESLQRVRQAQLAPPSSAQLSEGLARTSVELVWKLE